MGTLLDMTLKKKNNVEEINKTMHHQLKKIMDERRKKDGE